MNKRNKSKLGNEVSLDRGNLIASLEDSLWTSLGEQLGPSIWAVLEWNDLTSYYTELAFPSILTDSDTELVFPSVRNTVCQRTSPMWFPLFVTTNAIEGTISSLLEEKLSSEQKDEHDDELY